MITGGSGRRSAVWDSLWLLTALAPFGLLLWAGFVYVGVQARRRAWWLSGLGYLLALIVAFSVPTAAGAPIALFAWIGGIVHALLINPRRLVLRGLRQPPSPTAAPAPAPAAGAPDISAAAAGPQDPDAVECAELRAHLSSLTAYLNSYPASFPPECATLLRQLITTLSGAVEFAASNQRRDTQLAAIRAILVDYLPSSIASYVRLPREFATTHHNADGNTPADELAFQLQLLHDNATDVATALYTGDAEQLRAQSNFLRSKFPKSELDLP